MLLSEKGILSSEFHFSFPPNWTDGAPNVSLYSMDFRCRHDDEWGARVLFMQKKRTSKPEQSSTPPAISREPQKLRRMTQYRIYHQQGNKYVGIKRPHKTGTAYMTETECATGTAYKTETAYMTETACATEIASATGTAPSHGSELIFSESDGSYFEFIPVKRKWCHIKHVTDGHEMYVTIARASNNTLMLSHKEPEPDDDLFKYKKKKKHIKCKVSKQSKFKEFWYGKNPAPDTVVKVRQVSGKVKATPDPESFVFILKN